MKSLLDPSVLLPVGLLLLQTVAIFFLCYAVLKKIKWIEEPLAGMDYSQAILSGAVLFAVFFINTACINPGFQAYKTYQNQGGAILQPLLAKCGQFFLIILFFEALLFISIYIMKKILAPAGKENETGFSIPFAIFLSVAIIGLAIVYQQMAGELISYTVPKFLSFR